MAQNTNKTKYNIIWNLKRTSIYFNYFELELFLAQNHIDKNEVQNTIQKIADNEKNQDDTLSIFIKSQMLIIAAIDTKNLYDIKHPTLF